MTDTIPVPSSWSAFGPDFAIYVAIAMLSVSRKPSGPSKAGILPSGNLAKNSGVLLVSFMVKGGNSSSMPFMSAMIKDCNCRVVSEPLT